MKRNTLILSSMVAVALLTGCGGGGGDDTVTTTTSTVADTELGTYSAFVPLISNPTSFECDTVTDKAGMYAVGTSYATLEECQSFADAWLEKYNMNDTPATEEQRDGLAYLNTIRAGVGLPEFKYNALLETATANHENYLGDVGDTYGVNMAHYEDNVNYPSVYYTGDTATDRAKYVGYDGYYAGDVISYQSNGTVTDSLNELMSAIYHRQALLWNFTHEIGLGGVQRNFDFKSQPHLMGVNSDTDTFLRMVSPELVAYPYDGEQDVRVVFYGESPDPLPDLDDGTGNPISVSFNSAFVTSVDVTSFKLYFDDNNTEVTNVRILDQDTDPNDRFSEFDYALFPLDVLENGTTYRVELKYIQDGESREKVWSFTTLRSM